MITNPIACLRRTHLVAGIQWSCSNKLEGCLLHVGCSSNHPLLLDTLSCQLDGRTYDCKR